MSLDDGGDVVLDDYVSAVLLAGLFVQLLGHFTVELSPCDLIQGRRDFVLVKAGVLVVTYPDESL